MSYEDKLTLLASSKEALRVKLGLPKNLPLSEYYKHSYPFDPMTLFAGGKQGVWLDPSDLKTMFQNESGVILPVTKDGDPVGLILDKSQGLEKEILKTSLKSIGGWLLESEGVYIANKSANAPGSLILDTASPIVIGRYYTITFDATDYLSGYVKVLNPFDSGFSVTVRSNGSYTFSGIAKSTNFILLSVTADVTVSNVVITEIKGNHASQSLAASRPTYRTDGDLHWLQFDGADDFLSANFNPTAISTLRFFSSTKGVGTGLRVLYSTSYNKSAPVINKTLSGNITGIGYAPNVGGYKSFNHSKPVSQPFVNTDVFDYTSNTFAYRDGLGAPVITSITNPRSFDSLLISSQTGGSFFMSGNLYGLIVGVNMNITNDSLVMYLANKSGVAL